ncbi:hypothetical protein BGZ73_004165 [Actinomortierella ambigua]|nr:hypothetical protein BGZ73_004165 [Actinomortierella ambigua]
MSSSSASPHPIPFLLLGLATGGALLYVTYMFWPPAQRQHQHQQQQRRQQQQQQQSGSATSNRDRSDSRTPSTQSQPPRSQHAQAHHSPAASSSVSASTVRGGTSSTGATTRSSRTARDTRRPSRRSSRHSQGGAAATTTAAGGGEDDVDDDEDDSGDDAGSEDEHHGASTADGVDGSHVGEGEEEEPYDDDYYDYDDYSAVPGEEVKSHEGFQLMNLLYAIAEDQAKKEGYIHRGITCNSCNTIPIRGLRYKCANCPDFDLCEACEAADIHNKNHVFLKIRVPIPPLANPRTPLVAPFYPGTPHGHTLPPEHLIWELKNKTHFDHNELVAMYDQYLSLSTLEQEGGGITRQTFEMALGPLGLERNLITDRLFRFFDQGRDGIIDFPEFASGLSVLCKGNFDEKIVYAFQGYDLDGDGFISREELYEMFKAYFNLSMELIKDVVKTMENGLVDSFEYQPGVPVSATFTAPIPREINNNSNNNNNNSNRQNDAPERPARSSSAQHAATLAAPSTSSAANPSASTTNRSSTLHSTGHGERGDDEEDSSYIDSSDEDEQGIPDLETPSHSEADEPEDPSQRVRTRTERRRRRRGSRQSSTQLPTGTYSLSDEDSFLDVEEAQVATPSVQDPTDSILTTSEPALEVVSAGQIATSAGNDGDDEATDPEHGNVLSVADVMGSIGRMSNHGNDSGMEPEDWADAEDQERSAEQTPAESSTGEEAEDINGKEESTDDKHSSLHAESEPAENETQLGTQVSLAADSSLRLPLDLNRPDTPVSLNQNGVANGTNTSSNGSSSSRPRKDTPLPPTTSPTPPVQRRRLYSPRAQQQQQQHPRPTQHHTPGSPLSVSMNSPMQSSPSSSSSPRTTPSVPAYSIGLGLQDATAATAARTGATASEPTSSTLPIPPLPPLSPSASPSIVATMHDQGDSGSGSTNPPARASVLQPLTSSSSSSAYAATTSYSQPSYFATTFPVMETITQDAIQEMVDKTFNSVKDPARPSFIGLEEFRQYALTDAGIMGWFDALGSIF